MTGHTAHAGLITRLEAATGPNRDLDAWIAICAGIAPPVAFRPCVSLDPGTFGIGAYEIWVAPTYTASLDAALTLVPEDYDWIIGRTNGGLTIHACCGGTEEHFGDTPAIALCIAALKARSQT